MSRDSLDVPANFTGFDPQPLIHLVMKDNVRGNLKLLAYVCEKRNYSNRILSDMMLSQVISIFDQCLTSTFPDIMQEAFEFVSKICLKNPGSRSALANLGMCERFAKLLELEQGNLCNKHFVRSDGTFYTVARLAAEFLPSLPDDYEYNFFAWREILFSGPKLMDRKTETKRTALIIIRQMFPSFYKFCNQPAKSSSNFAVLLKMIYWAAEFNVIEKLVNASDFVRFLCEGLGYDDEVTSNISMEILDLMSKKNSISLAFEESLIHQLYMSFLAASPRLTDRMKSKFEAILSRVIWPLEEPEVVVLKTLIKQSYYPESTLEYRTSLINRILVYILIDPHAEKEDISTLDNRYVRLREFIECIFDLPRDSNLRRERVKFSSEGIELFQTLVRLIIRTADECYDETEDDFVHEWDLPDQSLYQHISETVMTTSLVEMSSLGRVLGPSSCSDKLATDPLVQSLRLLSILYEVNENCGSLFICILGYERLIDRRYFVNEQFDLYNYESEDNTQFFRSVALQYPFILSFDIRKVLFDRIKKSHMFGIGYGRPHSIILSRTDLARNVANNSGLFDHALNRLEVQFLGEKGAGAGPIKEFYSEFSRDCQRHDLDLWLGEKGSNFFVEAENGLFPKPKASLTQVDKNLLEAIGTIMAKAMLEDQMLDIDFSRAFYKQLFCSGNPSVQQLNVHDLGDVVPFFNVFVPDIVDLIREKWRIVSDPFLSPSEQAEALGGLNINGSKLEDLCISFTVPGCQEMETVEGGNDIFLEVDNVEMYLKCLVWTILHRGPRNVFDLIRKAFDKLLPVSYVKLLYPDEIERMLCGMRDGEDWSIHYLKENCEFGDGLSAKSQVVTFLFGVMCQMTPEERKRFFKFVTSRPRLPIGGLSALSPRLTVRPWSPNGDPDECLPMATTCTNSLILPDYSSEEALKRKLLLAINEGLESFDFR